MGINFPSTNRTALLFSAFLVLWSCCRSTSASAQSFVKRNAEEETLYADEPPTLPPDFNICDLKGSYPIYCYCNYITPNDATEGNCWIIDDMSSDTNQHIWEGLSTQSGIQSLTLHLRSDGILHKIPTIAIQHLPNIKSFEVQYGTIRAILPFNFANSSTLEKISLARNSIERLESNATSASAQSFVKRNAEEETLYADEPPTLPPDFNICDLKGSYPIYCYCNYITPNDATEGNCWIIDDMSSDTNQHIWEGLSTQSGIQSLTLHLRSDGILHKIPTIAIQHLPNIKSFEVQYGTIRAILPFNFANSSTLEKISLARNSIERLESNAFANLPSLTTLNFGENHLTDINRGVFVNLQKLTHLSMDRNNITGIEDRAFMELHKLIELKLFTNQIKDNKLLTLGTTVFAETTELMKLDIRNNVLETLLQDTVEPIQENLNSPHMQFLADGRETKFSFPLLDSSFPHIRVSGTCALQKAVFLSHNADAAGYESQGSDIP
ncbi:Leucine-rich repeat [Trinorchestia longiramus]|nr:Leucine-rich repeat [Trinorchestia longiramus]